MKKHQPCLILLATMLLVSLVLTGPAHTAGLSEVNPTAFYPWQVLVFAGFNHQKNPAPAFAGPAHIPFLSWTKKTYVDNDEERIVSSIVTARLAADGIGNCGPMIDNINTWECINFNFSENEAALDTTALMAVYNSSDHFWTGWVYQVNDPSTLTPLKIELTLAKWNPLGSLITASRTPLLALSPGQKVATQLDDDEEESGVLSLAFDSGGNPHAVVMLTDIDSGIESLIYIHPGPDDDTCGVDADFRCTTIVTGENLGVFPVIKLDAADQPLIVYYDGSAVSANLAYPQADAGLMPNCGTPTDPWRCVVIKPMEPDIYTIGDRPGLAVGSSARFVAYVVEAWDESEKSLYIAEYVGSGGNCGWDSYRDTSDTVQQAYRWQCRFVQWIDRQPDSVEGLISTVYSLQVDSLDYPVYAFTFQEDGNPQRCLGISYPAERAGIDSEDWLRQTIDCVSANSEQLTFNPEGLGWIAYEDKVAKTLKIAQQRYPVYLPVVGR